jgi:hypothetical protein
VIRTRPPHSRRRSDFRTTPLPGVVRLSPVPSRAALRPSERILRCSALVEASRARCLELRLAHARLLGRPAPEPGFAGTTFLQEELSRSTERLHHAEQSHRALTQLLASTIDEALLRQPPATGEGQAILHEALRLAIRRAPSQA